VSGWCGSGSYRASPTYKLWDGNSYITTQSPTSSFMAW
jgi:hypothetical protein